MCIPSEASLKTDGIRGGIRWDPSVMELRELLSRQGGGPPFATGSKRDPTGSSRIQFEWLAEASHFGPSSQRHRGSGWSATHFQGFVHVLGPLTSKSLSGTWRLLFHKKLQRVGGVLRGWLGYFGVGFRACFVLRGWLGYFGVGFRACFIPGLLRPQMAVGHFGSPHQPNRGHAALHELAMPRFHFLCKQEIEGSDLTPRIRQ